ncbi:MAG: Maf family protein [Simkaniaceae bacterium]|nr:Maf family protein [Simkaniaceae bacterium]MCF7851775.1 Maf family protein [Simkaniaceae bacterium]
MIILGSKSQRRQEIFSFFSIPFQVAGSIFDERSVPFQGFARDYVETIAVEKGSALARDYPDSVILTADTAVFFGRDVLNKPSSFEEAYEMLTRLNGKKHEVVTGVAIRRGNEVHTASESTIVEFNQLNTEQIKAYIKHVDVLDKAGSYAIQGIGSLLIKNIDGCFYNVMGLPMNATRDLLVKMRIDIWQYIKPSA